MADEPKRDPRVDPKAGDVLTSMVYQMRFNVTRCENRKVWFELTQHRDHPFYAIPMECKESLPGWRNKLKNAEVIHAAY